MSAIERIVSLRGERVFEQLVFERSGRTSFLFQVFCDETSLQSRVGPIRLVEPLVEPRMLRPSALGGMLRPARHLAVSSRHFAAAACRFDHLGGEQPASMKGRLPVTLFWDGARKRGLGP